LRTPHNLDPFDVEEGSLQGSVPAGIDDAMANIAMLALSKMFVFTISPKFYSVL